VDPLAPVLLNTIELSLEKLDPLDLLPLLELLDEEEDPEMLGPVPLPVFEMPGPEFEIPGPALDPLRSASLCVHTPSAR
jgi:hypothetical protein